MKFRVFIILILLCQIGFAQYAFQNNGNIQIHEEGQVGFHTDVVNNGVFEDNLGLVGFYSVDDHLIVSGTNEAVFNNVEVSVFDDLFLEKSITVSNNLSFITGKVITPRENLDVSLNFSEYFLHSGEGDYTHVDGYVSSRNNEGEFIFPIGDNDFFRPMIIPSQKEGTLFNGAYFAEDPNNPSTFNNSFNTSEKQAVLGEINDVEFWDLEGTSETAIILTWTKDSDVSKLATKIEYLRVVGWDKATSKWVDLGGETITGDMDNGTIKSLPFIPNNYEILTIGSDVRDVLGVETATNNNYAFSPNGDGINDYFVIEGIELRPNNSIQIINRWGAMVYSKDGYDNTWNGISEHSLTINKSKGLPTGTYYYFLKYHDTNTTVIGYIYLVH